jgi:hypothetical protein
MGTCQYCRLPAGFLRHQHKSCHEKSNHGRALVAYTLSSIITISHPLDEVWERVRGLAKESFVSDSDLRALAIESFGDAVEKALCDNILTEDEEAKLVQMRRAFALSDEEIDRKGALTKVVKSAILRDLAEGNIPKRQSLEGFDLPINLRKGETIVWAFKNAGYFEDRTKRQFVGRSQGVSLRVVSGVYLRLGASQGHAIESTERVHADQGILFMTDQNLYFSGPKKSFRIPWSKIVSFKSFSNGIGVTRDAASAKPQIFSVGDGWFAYNLASHLAKIA